MCNPWMIIATNTQEGDHLKFSFNLILITE